MILVVCCIQLLDYKSDVLTDDKRGALAEGRNIELKAATIGGNDLHH
jgi:hypothetical protein